MIWLVCYLCESAVLWGTGRAYQASVTRAANALPCDALNDDVINDFYEITLCLFNCGYLIFK